VSTRPHSATLAAVLVIAGLTADGRAQTSNRRPLAPAPSGWKQAAYIKASNPGEGHEFGYAVALSGDGNTLAVGAHIEDSGARGINGNQADHSVFSAGAVYVFARSAGGTWSQQAYVKASNPRADDQFGLAVALSGDGNTLAVSAPYEDSGATGINGNQNDNSTANAGAVYVFARGGGAWSQQAYVKASNTGDKDEGDQFGYSIALSGDGSTLAVGAIGEDSNATGVNGDQANNAAQGSGAVYVFTRSGSMWTQHAYVKSSDTRPNVMFGYSVALNGSGDTLAVGEFDADRGRGALYTFGKSAGAWSQQARLQPKLLSPQDSMGCWVAISGDGNTVIAGALDEDSLTTGINAAEGGHSGVVDGPDDNSSGAVFAFVRTGTAWSEQVNFKASNSGKHDWFGVRLALSGDGNTLAVGAPNEDSAGQGINGKQDDDSADEAGAAYVYTRSGATWAFRDYMKGAKNAKFDEFGSALALSRDGRVLAVGAHFESGGSSGVNGNQSGTPIPRSGAVYIFTR
jgi:hypothetical protein